MNVEAPTSAAPPSVVGVLAPSFAASMRDLPIAVLLAQGEGTDADTTAPDPLRDLIRRRLQTQDTAVAALAKELRATADGMDAYLVDWIEGRAGSSKDAAVKAAIYRLRLEDLDEMLEDFGLGKARGAYYRGLAALPTLAEKTLGAVGVADSDRALDSEGAKAAMRAYLEHDVEDFWEAEIAHPSRSRILRGLRSSIEAQPLAEAAKIIARDEGISYARAARAARNNAAEYDRFVNAEAARQADPDGETMLSAFTGPDDGIERPFCDQLNGLYFTRAQVGALDNAQPGSGHALYACGGFNCRHQWTHGPADLLDGLGFRRGADSDVDAANAAAAGSR